MDNWLYLFTTWLLYKVIIPQLFTQSQAKGEGIPFLNNRFSLTKKPVRSRAIHCASYIQHKMNFNIS